MSQGKNKYIIGAGITGLAAGCVSGMTIFEAHLTPGGLCSSYYVRPGDVKRNVFPPENGEAYRFENGGGHWIFGADDDVLRFLKKHVSLKKYVRRSSVYFSKNDLYVPYPLQNHLRYLDKEIIECALNEIHLEKKPFRTMKEWLSQSFGPTLCDLFFYPFHELYTADLYSRIAPQDSYKSPVDLQLVMQGALQDVSPVGYNATFVYPEGGLDLLAMRLADSCDIRYNKRVTKIDTDMKELFFDDSTRISYDSLISTIPLNKMIEISGIEVKAGPDPYTSVLVINIGAERGGLCPDDNWLYIPDSSSGFHRVGFYSNVDRSFLPASARENNDRVGIYVERAYPGGVKPSVKEINRYSDNVLHELQTWGFIGDVDVMDHTWIDVAYTWTWPGSKWRQAALAEKARHNIYQIGRYGRWNFQGIAESLKEGLAILSSIK